MNPFSIPSCPSLHPPPPLPPLGWMPHGCLPSPRSFTNDRNTGVRRHRHHPPSAFRGLCPTCMPGLGRRRAHHFLQCRNAGIAGRVGAQCFSLFFRNPFFSFKISITISDPRLSHEYPSQYACPTTPSDAHPFMLPLPSIVLGRTPRRCRRRSVPRWSLFRRRLRWWRQTRTRMT
jgi:hypothetical protein